jgi:hypothetical protein
MLAGGLAGCSSRDNLPERVPVTGTVIYQQQPVAGASVAFHPQGSTVAAMARTDEQGRFSLMTYTPDDGALPGDYVVTITKTEITGGGPQATDDAPAPPSIERSLLPDKYASTSTSGLRETVVAGTPRDIRFELEEGVISAVRPGAGSRPAPRTRE